MSITFADITKSISDYQPIQVVNENKKTIYLQAQLLSDCQAEVSSGTILVGFASLVPPALIQREDIGMILINDCNFNLSQLKGNGAELPKNTDIFSLFNNVLETLHSRRKISEISAAFLDCLVEGKSLNEIIEIGASLIGNPISLVDYTGKQLAVSNQLKDISTNLEGMTPDGYPTQQSYSKFRTKKYTKKVNESSTPIFVEMEHPDVPRLIVGKIAIRNKIVGHLALLELQQPIVEDDIKLVEVLINVITAIVQQDNYYLLMAGIQHEYFILDLIKENHDSPTTIEDRVKSLQWDTYNDFYVVTISIPRKNDTFFFVEYLRTRLGNIFPFSKSIYHEENVILVIYKDQDIQQIRKKLEEILIENHLAAGISLKFSSIVDLKQHYEQAKHAVSIGKLLKREDNTYLYDDLYIYDLLTIVNRHANLKDFCHPGLETILAYDKENGTEYYETLYEYLINNADMTQVAKKLYIHRNTLYHRIKKIFELTKLDLDNGNDNLKLLISYKIMELYNIHTNN